MSELELLKQQVAMLNQQNQELAGKLKSQGELFATMESQKNELTARVQKDDEIIKGLNTRIGIYEQILPQTVSSSGESETTQNVDEAGDKLFDEPQTQGA